MKTSLFVALALTSAFLLTGCADATDATDGPGGGSSAASTSGGDPTLDGTSVPPWPTPTDDVPERVAAAGLDLGPMGTAEHYHPHLSILIDGTEVPVPPNIGVDPSTGAMSALHTHEGDGTLHIEADTKGEVFTLGQLFTQWGVTLTSTQIGGVRADFGQRVEVTNNGTKVTRSSRSPADLRLEPDQQIVLSLR